MITALTWKNHDILKNLELDFSKSDGTPYNTIVLAGDNGTGKTTILETIATFLDGGSFAPFENIRYDIRDEQFELNQNGDVNPNHGFHYRIKSNGGPKYVNNSNIDNDFDDIRYYGVAYSPAGTVFTTKTVKTATSLELDKNRSDIDKREDFTQSKQLLVDLSSQDNEEWMKISEEGHVSQQRFEEFKASSKMSRFVTAFDNFFETMKFSEIKTEGGEKNAYFEKQGNSVSMDHLSTGEKQIVFRGTHLLKNLKRINGGVVLIDEPELSMHPKWQEKILGYYRRLFTIEGNQATQLIVATHSEYVLKAALEDKENVLVIVLQDEGGKINARKITHPFVLPTITSAEINYMAFKVPSIDYHIELYGYLQNKTGKTKVKDCDEYIKASTQYNATKHAKASCFTDARGHVINYETLPTFIRNKIDHPQLTSPANEFTRDELLCSIELLVELCKPAVPHP